MKLLLRDEDAGVTLAGIANARSLLIVMMHATVVGTIAVRAGEHQAPDIIRRTRAIGFTTTIVTDVTTHAGDDISKRVGFSARVCGPKHIAQGGGFFASETLGQSEKQISARIRGQIKRIADCLATRPSTNRPFDTLQRHSHNEPAIICGCGGTGRRAGLRSL